MLVRIFGDAPDPAEWTSTATGSGPWDAKLVQSLCQLAGRHAWTIELCDPMTWGTRTRPADLHIYLTEPCRMAVPWAACNVALVSRAWWAADIFGAEWLPWAATEIDLFVVHDGGEPVAGLPEDRVFVLREAAKGGSPLRAFADSWRRLMETAERKRHAPALPASLPKGSEVPYVGIITLTRNRPQWWPLMLRNVAGARWPLKRMEWIIVEDSDADKSLEDEVTRLRGAAATADIVVRYVKLTPGSPTSIGAKRNAAVAAASSHVNLFVCMDDDDHYPEDSIGRRVSWLTDGSRGAAYCATLPMYDLTRYISAINTPPLVIGAAKRVSEATLAFTREFWATRPFPEVSMAEGEGFLAGRETQTVEIPPYGVIVSFIHRGNTSSRRVPAEQPANGCHYGFTDEFFTLVHEIALIK